MSRLQALAFSNHKDNQKVNAGTILNNLFFVKTTFRVKSCKYVSLSFIQST